MEDVVQRGEEAGKGEIRFEVGTLLNGGASVEVLRGRAELGERGRGTSMPQKILTKIAKELSPGILEKQG